jgi:hypothetical protein
MRSVLCCSVWLLALCIVLTQSQRPLFGPFVGAPILPRDAVAPQDSAAKREPFALWEESKVGWTSAGDGRRDNSPVKRKPFAVFAAANMVGFTSVGDGAAVGSVGSTAGFSRDDHSAAKRSPFSLATSWVDIWAGATPGTSAAQANAATHLRDVSPAERDANAFGMVDIKGSQAWSAGHKRDFDAVSPAKRGPFGWIFVKGPFNWGAGHRKRDIVHQPPSSSFDNPGVSHKVASRAPFSASLWASPWWHHPAGDRRSPFATMKGTHRWIGRSPFAWWKDSGRWIGRRFDTLGAALARRAAFGWWRTSGPWIGGRSDAADAHLASRGPFSWKLLDAGRWNGRRSDAADPTLATRNPFNWWLDKGRWGGHRRAADDATLAGRSPFAVWRTTGKWAHRRDTKDASLAAREPFGTWWVGQWGSWGSHRRATEDASLAVREPFGSWWTGQWGPWGSHRRDIDDAWLAPRSPFSPWFPRPWAPPRREAGEQHLSERNATAGGQPLDRRDVHTWDKEHRFTGSSSRRDVTAIKREPFSWWKAHNFVGSGTRRDIDAEKRSPFTCWWCASDWNGGGAARRDIDVDHAPAAKREPLIHAVRNTALPRRDEEGHHDEAKRTEASPQEARRDAAEPLAE